MTGDDDSLDEHHAHDTAVSVATGCVTKMQSKAFVAERPKDQCSSSIGTSVEP